jgi:cytochrome c oxidase subunit 2
LYKYRADLTRKTIQKLIKRKGNMNKLFLIILLFGLLGLLVACGGADVSPATGQNLAVLKGCVSCHSVDDTTKIAPPWQGLYGKQIELNDGSFVTVDDNYLIESIKDPNAKIVKGFTRGAMPLISLTDEEISALVAYIKSVK